ncbi:hypothetical protein RSOLAG1IB_03641 [Rhizoctonia solani AG-1 IB]|uniref:Uncharacterized protein n=1 Tax=Thanatephorus cucumeris (strain AG1-IB / isolate 7/3/14) TaxID=1108050 RepID=A0A0B7FU07_THACB|nr:hypothetical protein RSOLAG1IB_03641 [Rhizoctonia solani AG-1 IB]
MPCLAQSYDEAIKKDQQIACNEAIIHKLQGDLEAKESSHLQTKLSQQQTEIAGLQAKIDRLEYLVSQMRATTRTGYLNKTRTMSRTPVTTYTNAQYQLLS